MLSKYAIAVLLLSFISVQAFGEEELKPGQILRLEHNQQNWTIHYINSEETDKIVIKNAEAKIEMSYSSDSRAHNLIAVAPLLFKKNQEIFFVTIWSKGAHGETIRILNPKLGNQEKAQLFYYHSAWPLSYKTQDDKFIITGKGDMDEEGQFLDEIKVFEP